MKTYLVNTLVSDCMARQPITIDCYASLAQANELMQVNKIRRLPVLQRDKLVGIITLSDVLDAKPSDIKQPMNVALLNQFLSNIIVDLAMSREPVTVYQNDTIGHAAELMLDQKIGGLPVIDSTGRLVGMLTESDIFRTIVRHWRKNNLIELRVGQ